MISGLLRLDDEDVRGLANAARIHVEIHFLAIQVRLHLASEQGFVEFFHVAATVAVEDHHGAEQLHYGHQTLVGAFMDSALPFAADGKDFAI